jgi:hypothetical protein
LLDVLGRARAVTEESHPFPWAELRPAIERACAAGEASNGLFWVAHDTVGRAGAAHVTVHHSRVAVLAVRVGALAGYNLERRIELGMAGALIDVALWSMRWCAAPTRPR